MEELIKMLNLDESEIDSYIDRRLGELNLNENYVDILLDGDTGNIYSNWVNSDTTYRPYGYDSKGFKVDKKFIVDMISIIRGTFNNFSIDSIKNSFTEDKLILWLNIQIPSYFYDFDGSYVQSKKEKIFNNIGHINLNNISTAINLSDLKKQDVAECLEKSAALNAILNFLGIDSSLVVAYANDIGHAYCLVKMSNGYSIVDPSHFGKISETKHIQYVFKVDPSNSSFTFDPKEYGDVSNAPKLEYVFPCEKFSSIKKQ